MPKLPPDSVLVLIVKVDGKTVQEIPLEGLMDAVERYLLEHPVLLDADLRGEIRFPFDTAKKSIQPRIELIARAYD